MHVHLPGLRHVFLYSSVGCFHVVKFSPIRGYTTIKNNESYKWGARYAARNSYAGDHDHQLRKRGMHTL
eukprot:3933027-Rhodomonas_salina.1